MNIRYKLTIQFTLIVAAILLIFTSGIYFFSSNYRQNDYYKRLEDRAKTTARLLLNVKEVDETLLKIIDKNTLALYQEKVYIIDEKNKQIYCNTEGSVFNNSAVIYEIKNKELYKFKLDKSDAVGILYRYNNLPYVVIASAYDIFGIAKIKNLGIILVVGYLLSLSIAVLAGLLFSGRALAPISAVVNQVKKITITNLNLRVDEGNKKDEIALLAITFNQMLQRLEEAFILQRNFVSNAAHELRTPFTVLLAEIEYGLLQDREKKHYIQILNNLSVEIKKLSKLSNGLLDLARISFDKSNFELKSVRLDELLVETCNDLVNVNTDYNTKINFENMPENDDLLTVFGNEQLIKIAIKNLVENACKFSNDKAVNIYFSANNGYLELKFCDNGIGISREDIKNIFQPFYRGSNTQFFAGYGLGLALTMKVIELHNGKISVESQLEKGSVFTLTLPNKSYS